MRCCMNNVLIVTFWKARNYGAFLQCYALQKKITGSKVLAYKARSIALNVERKKKYSYIWPFLAPYWIVKDFVNQMREPTFSEWKQIPFQPCKIVRNTLELSSKYDSVVVGSDQIWNSKFVLGEENVYFANFISNDSIKLSYAASLGQSSWHKEFESKAVSLLKNFKFVSVREESSVKYLHSVGLENVVCVCDPTILHDGDFYRKEFNVKRENRIFSFVYTIREKVPESLKKILLPESVKCTLDGYKIPSVSEWLSYIDNAKFVVTDSFHCCVFCLLFHKPFMVLLTYGEKSGMNERFLSLLEKTGLDTRILSLTDSYECALSKLNAPIDWPSVDDVLHNWRKESFAWLQENLTLSNE